MRNAVLFFILALAAGCAERERFFSASVTVRDAETGMPVAGALVGVRPVAKGLTGKSGAALLFWLYKPTFVESFGWFLAQEKMSYIRSICVEKEGYAAAIAPLGEPGERLADRTAAEVRLRRLKEGEGKYDGAYAYYTALFRGAKDDEMKAFARNMMDAITQLRAYGTAFVPWPASESPEKSDAYRLEFGNLNAEYDRSGPVEKKPPPQP